VKGAAQMRETQERERERDTKGRPLLFIESYHDDGIFDLAGVDG